MGCRNMTTGKWRVLWHPVCTPETNIDDAVRAVVRELHGKLLHEAAPIGGSDFGSGATKVVLDACMTPNRLNRFCVENGLGSAHVVEVCVDHCNDRSVGDRSKFDQSVAHFLNRLAGVDGDDSIGRSDERLV